MAKRTVKVKIGKKKDKGSKKEKEQKKGKVKLGKKGKTVVKEKPKSLSGQTTGPKIEHLKANEKEIAVAKVLIRKKKAAISDIAEACFKSKGEEKSNSWTRNALRRLVRAGWVKKIGRGTYEITAKGKSLPKPPEKPAKEKKSKGKKAATKTKAKKEKTGKKAKVKIGKKTKLEKSKPEPVDVDESETDGSDIEEEEDEEEDDSEDSGE